MVNENTEISNVFRRYSFML